jgi:oligopeptide/dipeptide ABC transporter ATP-binding protein
VTTADIPASAGALLAVEGLKTWFQIEGATTRSVDGVSFSMRRGETLAIVGESGSGKSVTSLSIMRLIPSPPGRIVAGSIRFEGRDGIVRDLAAVDERQMFAIRGNEIGMIFQEPMTSLNPVHTVGAQIAEVLRLHRGQGRREAKDGAVDMLARVGIADPATRALEYPHQMSGGMRQRVMIAMSLVCRPALLIADEPTTALDVTIQAQILRLMQDLQAELRMGILFITHNLGVVAEIADRVAVMYAGRVVEEGGVEAIFDAPCHPYTRALLASIPRPDLMAHNPSARLAAIPGNVPIAGALPPGCAFAPRCPMAIEACHAAVPDLDDAGDGHMTRCIRWREL